MKKLALVYGSIAGLIVSLMMIISFLLLMDVGEEMDTSSGMIIGFSTQILAFTLIFIAINTYKKRYMKASAGFGLRFWKGLKIGLIMSLLASFMYVGTWAVLYTAKFSDYPEKYFEKKIEQAVEQGKTPVEIEAIKSEKEKFVKLYNTVPGFVGMTLMEIFPTGVLLSLIAALVFAIKKKKEDDSELVTT